MTPLRYASFLALALGLTACGPAGQDVRTTDVSNSGSACIRDTNEVLVNFDRCLSSSCDTLVDASCTATVDGTTLVVTSAGTIETDLTADGCTSDCRSSWTTCAITGDPSAVTEIAYADGTTTELGCATVD